MKVTKSININKELWNKLEQIAKGTKRSMSSMVELIIEEYIKNEVI